MICDRLLSGVLAIVMLGGCSGQASDPYKGQQSASFDELTPQEHLRCAALISAYNRLQNTGLAESDAARDPRVLEALMWHHNAYSLPSGLQEQTSMQEVNDMREEILSRSDATSTISEAKDCIDMVE